MQNYCGDKVNDDATEIVANHRLNNKIAKSKSFVYKTKIIGRAAANNDELNTEVIGPLKYLSIFWRSLDLSLINC